MKIKVIFAFVVVLNLSVFGTTTHSDSKNSALNTAANASYLNDLEKEIVYEINLFRSNPARYAELHIAPIMNKFKDKLLYYPGDNPLQTKEGVRAVEECVRELRKATSKSILFPSKGLSEAAKDHVQDQSKTGRTGHGGSDKSTVKSRIERYGEWKVRIAENIAYGGISARQVVVYLLIDDGVSNRGHRKNFLHPDYKKVGVAYGNHPHYNNMCVMDFAGGFYEK